MYTLVVVQIARVLRTLVAIATLVVARATVGNWCVHALIVPALVVCACVIVVALRVAVAAALDRCVRALVCLQIAIVKRANVAIATVAVTVAAAWHWRGDTAVIHTSRVCARIVVVWAIGVVETAVWHIGANTLVRVQVAVLDCARVMIVALGLTSAAILNGRVRTLAMLAARIQCAHVIIIALADVVAAAGNRCTHTLEALQIAVLVSASIMVVAVLLAGAAVRHFSVFALVGVARIIGANVVVVALRGIVATAWNRLNDALVGRGVASIDGAKVAIVAFGIARAAAWNLSTTAIASGCLWIGILPANFARAELVIVALLITRAAVGQVRVHAAMV